MTDTESGQEDVLWVRNGGREKIQELEKLEEYGEKSGEAKNGVMYCREWSDESSGGFKKWRKERAGLGLKRKYLLNFRGNVCLRENLSEHLSNLFVFWEILSK